MSHRRYFSLGRRRGMTLRLCMQVHPIRGFSTSTNPPPFDLKLLEKILDPTLGEPVLFAPIDNRVVLDPISPLLETRKRFATQARRSLGLSDEIIIVPQHPTLPRPNATKRTGNLANIRNVIAVSSGKGGVGKSTVAVNLASSLMQLGCRVGIFDADIHGPSLPTMMVPSQGGSWSVVKKDKNLDPILLHGMKSMSYGFVSPGTGGKGSRAEGQDLASVKGPSASIMRGPIASKTAEELLKQTIWDDLDFLVVDLPPGTGDLHLTICQQLQVDSAVVVTTPQELAFVDVARGIDMLDALKVPVVAIVENMSSFFCDHGKEYFIFGTKGKANVERLKRAYGIPWTVSLPIVPYISDAGDEGTPFVLSGKPENNLNVKEAKHIYLSLAKGVCDETLKLHEIGKMSRPQVTYDANTKMLIIRTFDKSEAKQYRIPPVEIRKRLSKVDEMMGVRKKLNEDVFPKQISAKGNYAVSIAWSDGHSMSIYPFDDLIAVAQGFESSITKS